MPVEKESLWLASKQHIDVNALLMDGVWNKYMHVSNRLLTASSWVARWIRYTVSLQKRLKKKK